MFAVTLIVSVAVVDSEAGGWTCWRSSKLLTEAGGLVACKVVGRGKSSEGRWDLGGETREIEIRR